MARIIGTIFTSEGPANVAAYTAGETCIVHRGLLTDTWTVTHKRTGLALTTQHPTRDDAVACGMGASFIIRHYGDRGTFGDGAAVNAPGPMRDAFREYIRTVNGRADSYLDGVGRERPRMLSVASAMMHAREAIRSADDIAWLRHGVETYGHGGA